MSMLLKSKLGWGCCTCSTSLREENLLSPRRPEDSTGEEVGRGAHLLSSTSSLWPWLVLLNTGVS